MGMVLSVSAAPLYNHALEQAADDWNDMHETESDSKTIIREPFKQKLKTEAKKF